MALKMMGIVVNSPSFQSKRTSKIGNDEVDAIFRRNTQVHYMKIRLKKNLTNRLDDLGEV